MPRISFCKLVSLYNATMKLLEIELLSDDLAATESFYRNVLGLEPVARGSGILRYFIGYTRLIFRRSENLKPVYHFAMDLPNNRFFDAYNTIRKKVELLKVEGDDDIANFTNWDAKSFYFKDNNSNILEGITRYPNRAFDDNPFSSRSFISISEIGLVTNNVPELADTLIKEYGLAVFKRQPRGDKFTVLGDDEGLFVIGEKGRNWYPTALPSRPFRTRILYMHDNNFEQIIR